MIVLTEASEDRSLGSIAPEIARLLTQLSSKSEERIRIQTEAALESDNNHIFLAIESEDSESKSSRHIVGLGVLTVIDIPTKRVGYVNDVIVNEAARGRGIGRSLTNGMIQKARSLGCDCIDLTSSPERTVAHKLYISLGFEERNTAVFRFNLSK